MGKLKAFIPLALGLVIASLVGIFAYKWLNVQTTQKELAKVEVASEVVPVAVAAADLPWGTKLSPEMLKTLPYLKESIPPGAFLDTESLKGRVVISPLRQNEPILECRLAPDNVTTGGVSAIVKPGKRALAVKGDKVIGLSGFIRPGNWVDVLVTMTNPLNKRKITKTVLENILVLATGIEIEENKEGGKPHSVDVYTLEVTPKEGEKLSLAANHGKLHFALRNVTDKEIVLTNGASIAGTLASLRPKKKKQASKTFTVEIIEGGKMTQKKFKL
jgi:pilus assembly protein CpaB